jgi:hypothetical protein
MYKQKYLKYKEKYLSQKFTLKNEDYDFIEQEGGAFTFEASEDIYPEDLKSQAFVEGKRLLDEWLRQKESNGINAILKKFNPDGTYIPSDGKQTLSATTFSDYYKWTMMPVIWHLHNFITEKTGKQTFKVTFGVDIRDENMRKTINSDPNLRTKIKDALTNLASRQFDRKMFDDLAKPGEPGEPGKPGEPAGPLYSSEKNGNLLDKECIDYICEKGTLANPEVILKEDGKPDYVEDDKVHIYFYKVKGAKYNSTDTEDELWFIEARGPWPRVTWLETSMMQAVYEAYLRYNLEKLAIDKGIQPDEAYQRWLVEAYQRWLYGALLRCARSVAYTRLVQKTPGKLMTPALFTGRRTGGYLFLMLQNLFFADHFHQFTAPPPPKNDAESVDDYKAKIDEWKAANYTDGKTSCLGTSSVDCFYELPKLRLQCLRPVGTHAHELSMVISVLFPYFDKNKYNLPLTQIIGHELYRKHSAVPRPLPSKAIMFPMLPDTLGTAAFMKAAYWVKVPKPEEPVAPKPVVSAQSAEPVASAQSVEFVPFIKLINSARQDSGKLENFLKIMDEWGYVGGKMASEIDNTETLAKATELGFTTYGAGGFFGDSGKVWNSTLSSPSMAVKAVNVEYCVKGEEYQFYKDLYFPHITIEPRDGILHVKGFPIKVGDPEDMTKPALAEGKLSLDKTLPQEFIEVIKCWVSNRRVRAFIDKDNDSIKKEPGLPIEKIMTLIPREDILREIREVKKV